MTFPFSRIILAVSALFCINSAFALDPDTNYGRMHVQISNETTNTCRLVAEEVIHGTLDSAPAQSIMMNDSKAFDMEQAYFGPEIILAYNCDNKVIRFEVQQDLTVFIGHTPVATVIENNGLNFQYISQASSVFWHSPGIVNISIAEQ